MNWKLPLINNSKKQQDKNYKYEKNDDNGRRVCSTVKFSTNR